MCVRMRIFLLVHATPSTKTVFENVFEHDTTRPTGHMYSTLSTHIFYVQTLLSMLCNGSSHNWLKVLQELHQNQTQKEIFSQRILSSNQWECEECSVDRPVGFAVLRLLTSWIFLIMMCISQAKDPSCWINKVLLLAQKAQDYPSWMGQVSKISPWLLNFWSVK